MMILNSLFIMLVVSSSLIGLIWEINKGINQEHTTFFQISLAVQVVPI